MSEPAAAQSTASKTQRFPCAQCGAKLAYTPGTAALTCAYCGHANAIPQSPEEIRELDFQAYVAQGGGADDTRALQVTKCSACGAEVERPGTATAYACPFCGADVVATATARTLIKPKSVLPFAIAQGAAREAFTKWLRRLWFAPSALVRRATSDAPLAGLYVPYWTYDCDATSAYRGWRGDYYWETETYTTTENGKTVRRTRQVRKIRWWPASGTVFNRFDDVLVCGSRSLPERHVARLEPWDLKNLVPYEDAFLAGFLAECYQVDLVAGFEHAKQLMVPTIEMTVRRDIGGDEQRIDSLRTRHDRVTFKHILLPIWLSAYRYSNRVYRFLVNGRTGEVQGERPYSALKITLAIIAGLLLLGVGLWLFAAAQGH